MTRLVRGIRRSTTLAWSATSWSTIWIACRGSTRGIRSRCRGVRLPRELPVTAATAVDVLAGTANVARTELSLSHLSRMLHLSAGVVRTSQRSFGTHLFRAAGSACGRFPLEVYVAAPEGGPVPGGVYWYHPQDHSLVLVGPPPHGDSPRPRRHRRAVAYRLALPRARIPPRLLGRRHDAVATVGGSRFRGDPGVAAHALSRSGGCRPGRRGRRPRVAGGRGRPR